MSLKNSETEEQKKQHSKIYDAFAFRSVYIVTRSLRGTQILSDGSKVFGNIILAGTIVDEDDKFIYLGDESGMINEAIKANDIIRVYTKEETNVSELFGEVGDLN